MNDKLLMLVVTHKMFDDSNLPDGYHVIKVGNGDFNVPESWLRDNMGDNIANLNPYYCELTAQYWAWKNYPSDYEFFGLSHYRRYFFNYRKKRSKSWKGDIVNETDIARILSKKKVIMSIPTVKYPGYGRLYRHKDNSKEKHWLLMQEIFKEHFPEYLDSFNKVLYGRFTIWGNMFIATKGVADDYSAWLFAVLTKFNEELEKRHDTKIPREDGYLAECLLMIYMYRNFSKRQIYHLEMRNVEQDTMYEYSHDGFKAKLISFVRRHRCLLMAVRKLRVGGVIIEKKMIFSRRGLEQKPTGLCRQACLLTSRTRCVA